ncbi:deoxyguanosinetriphosphate triphosphohydrolase family protein [Actinokineospora soli]|uniref:Deoxyguanosinetriphosphate triphosphohydrolase family protein n=1 Tax=Actinokineospora soli TaxID=1048753 RepID=A0ABW2TMH3_9PSEU
MNQPETQAVRLVSPALRTARNQRLISQTPHTSPSTSAPARRDRDRVLYSAAWRRLGGVTQVITPFDDSALPHTRLTHSEKVAQVARSIAECLLNQQDNADLIADLGGIDVHVVEAAALAHDLGHPPFGHIGEQTLDEVARDCLGLRDGFEGNAQTFRTVQLTETRHHAYDGLDLTSASLMAIAKYPWTRTIHDDDRHSQLLRTDTDYRRHWRKFSVYETEWEAFTRAREFLDHVGFPCRTQSIEASIMDVADDITYAIHDLEDFYTADILDIRRVITELRRVAKNGYQCELREQLSLDYPDFYDDALFAEAVSTTVEELESFRPRFPQSRLLTLGLAGASASKLIGRYIEAVEVRDRQFWKGGPFVSLRRAEWHEVQLLKKITKDFVIKRPDMAVLQRGQQRVLKDLVVQLHDWAESDFGRLPRYLREEMEVARGEHRVSETREWRMLTRTRCTHGFVDRGDENRCILDYLCTLTDGQCYALHRKLSGARPAASAIL